jgi:SAM-dependent methyltransferase
LDENLGVPLSEERFKNETRWPEELRGEIVLEAGSGMGRFTRCAAETNAEIFSFDYSNAIDANFHNNRHYKNIHFIQADIRKPPFKRELFDKIFCFGVLQHTPNPRQSFASIFELLKPAGWLATDVYRRTWKHLFWGQYYLRIITRRIPPEKLFPVVKVYFEIVHWLTGLLLPLSSHYSKVLSIVLGTADYRGMYPMDPKVMKEWCLLDTFDKLSPAFDNPQKIEDVEKWINVGYVDDYEVKPGYNGIEIHLHRNNKSLFANQGIEGDVNVNPVEGSSHA